jgi:hypothetical protein
LSANGPDARQDGATTHECESEIGEVYLNQQEFELAKARFQEAVKDAPQIASHIEELRKEQHAAGSSQ